MVVIVLTMLANELMGMLGLSGTHQLMFFPITEIKQLPHFLLVTTSYAVLHVGFAECGYQARLPSSKDFKCSSSTSILTPAGFARPPKIGTHQQQHHFPGSKEYESRCSPPDFGWRRG